MAKRKPSFLSSDGLEDMLASWERIRTAPTFLEALAEVNEIAALWANIAAHIEYDLGPSEWLLYRVRYIIACHRADSKPGQYSGLRSTPTDRIGLMEWTPEAIEIVRGRPQGLDEAASKGTRKPPTFSAEDKAIAVLRKHPDWTDTRIAEEAGINRTTLYKFMDYKYVRQLLKEVGRKELAHGSKDGETGNMDAWDE